MKKELHDSLVSTLTMLSNAFPNGLEESMLLPVIRVLYEEMSDRNIAVVLAHLTGKDESILLNKVYTAAALSSKSESVKKVQDILRDHGYEEWLKE